MTDVWEYLKSGMKPVVLYGTGNGADKILDVFSEKGIEVSDIFVSDDFFRGGTFRDFELISYSDVIDRYDDCIVVLAFAVFREDMLDFIKEIEKRYEVLAPEVPVFGTDYFSKETYCENIAEIEKARSLLADQESIEVFDNLLEYRLTGKLAPLYKAESDREAVFESIIKLNCNENYLDLGAYRGDTLEEFLELTGGSFSHITAFEPDLKNFKKMEETVESLKLSSDKKSRITLVNKASWNCEYVLDFSGGGGRNSSLVIPNSKARRHGEKIMPVFATDIDSFLKQNPELLPPSYVKMDVEGAEHETLLGMANLLKKSKPKLAISAYHKTLDLFTLPILINSINPDYKIYLRHHPYIPDWETNLYCI